MKPRRQRLNLAVAAFFCALALPGGALAGDAARLQTLFADLKGAEGDAAQRIESEIWIEWSKSGSAAMDMLLIRGREAMAAGEVDLAIGHLTALTDHAPDFAEGWNARATAYYNRGDYGLAVEDIAHALTLEPRHFGALGGLAMIFEDLGQPDRALEVYRAVKAIHPHAPGVSEAIARLEATTGGTDL